MPIQQQIIDILQYFTNELNMTDQWPRMTDKSFEKYESNG